MSVLHRVEERLDVEFQHPASVHVHQSAPERSQRLVRRAAGPEAVAAVQEVLLVNGFERHRHRTLQHLVLERRDAARPWSSLAFRYVHASYGWRAVRSGHQPLADVGKLLVEVL